MIFNILDFIFCKNGCSECDKESWKLLFINKEIYKHYSKYYSKGNNINLNFLKSFGIDYIDNIKIEHSKFCFSCLNIASKKNVISKNIYFSYAIASINEARDDIQYQFDSDNSEDTLCFIHPACFCYDVTSKNDICKFKINKEREVWHEVFCYKKSRKKVVNEIINILSNSKYGHTNKCCSGLGCSFSVNPSLI